MRDVYGTSANIVVRRTITKKILKLYFSVDFLGAILENHKPSQAKPKPSQSQSQSQNQEADDNNNGGGDNGDGDNGDNNFSLRSGPPSHTRQQQ